MAEIEAALTAEEWEKLEICGGDIDLFKDRIWFNDEIMWTDNLHGLAALALHGQPFGFTQEDIALLMRLSGTPEEMAGVRSLIRRIAALLPPKEPSDG